MSKECIKDHLQLLRKALDDINRDILAIVREVVMDITDDVRHEAYSDPRDKLQEMFDKVYALTETSMELVEDQHAQILDCLKE